MGKSSPERFTFGANGGELDYYVFTGGRGRTPKKSGRLRKPDRQDTAAANMGGSAISSHAGLIFRKNAFAT